MTRGERWRVSTDALMTGLISSHLFHFTFTAEEDPGVFRVRGGDSVNVHGNQHEQQGNTTQPFMVAEFTCDCCS